MKELSFMALYVSLKSAYNRNYPPEQRAEELKRSLNLPSDWKIDDVMKDAMRVYSLTQVTPSSAILASVRSAVYQAQKIVMFLEKRLKNTMDSLLTADLIGDEIDTLMDKALKDADKIQDVSAKLTVQLANLDTLEKKYVKEVEELKGRNQKEVNYHETEVDDD